MINRSLPATLALAMIGAGPALAQQPQMRIEAPREIPNPYGAYEFLIGDWYSLERPGGGQEVTIRQNFRWGPKQSYLLYTTYTSLNGQPETIHFEGMAVWNGKTKNLDYVVALEPGSGGQEQGTIHADSDGSIVRDVAFTGADGRTGVFRQRFWKDETGVVATSLMRKTDKGWEPNFPGSEKLVMARRP